MSDEKQDSKPQEEKKTARPMRVARKVGEQRGNLKKREQWFRRRAGGGSSS